MFKEFKKDYKKAFSKIKEYDTIVVLRHQRPDFDALGTQMGLATWLKESFPTKKIHYVGANHSTFTPKLYPPMEEINSIEGKYLAIVVDTANKKRIDGEEIVEKADYVIKFDHHPAEDQYGNINIVYNELSSASELLVDFVDAVGGKKKYPISELSAKYFYSGLVGDTGRFLFSSSNGNTLRCAGRLLDTGLVPAECLFVPMYEKDMTSMNFLKFVLNNMKVSTKGIGYYVLMDKDLKDLNVNSENGKEHLGTLGNIKGMQIWFCITELKDVGEYRVSIRSHSIDISTVANKYHGGGHKQASGATLYDLEKELPLLISDLEALL
jgi:nanoRNase/pAp phosphatase (c-di-AMP/oligoRNAs hydrolase)